MTRSTFALATLLLAPCSVFAQGALTPSGPPAPGMKTLQQIEPRIELATVPAGAGALHNITNPGSYFLSTNLGVPTAIGIRVDAAGVTLDLNGFEIARTGGSGGEGIRITSNGHSVTVRNGTIRGFSYGINSLFTPYAKGGLFEKLAVTGCDNYGIYAGDSARVVDCRAYNNTGGGIVALSGSVISGCTVQSNQGPYALYAWHGSRVVDCTAQGNTGNYGIYAGNGSTVSGCVAEGNLVDYGIYADFGSTITGCTATGNTGGGSISVGIQGGGSSTIMNCTSRDNSNTNSPTIADQGIGILVGTGGTIRGCTANFNRGDGIQASAHSHIEGNTAYGNGGSGDGAGIHTTGTRNRIEANSANGNDRGIDVDSTLNFIVRNNAGLNSTNYVIASNNIYGPIINRLAPTSAAVSGNSATNATGTSEPWANFAH